MSKKNKKSITMTDVYSMYKEKGGTLSKEEYSIICDKMFKLVADKILDGNAFSLGKSIGYIFINRFKKIFKTNELGNIKNGVVNWKESNRIKQELIDKGEPLWDSINQTGKKWIVYYDDVWNYRWAWAKKGGLCTIRNNTAYSFSPTSDNTYKGAETKLGNRSKLVKLLKENPNQYLKYIHK